MYFILYKAHTYINIYNKYTHTASYKYTNTNFYKLPD